jgi:hypothetical protein
LKENEADDGENNEGRVDLDFDRLPSSEMRGRCVWLRYLEIGRVVMTDVFIFFFCSFENGGAVEDGVVMGMEEEEQKSNRIFLKTKTIHTKSLKKYKGDEFDEVCYCY